MILKHIIEKADIPEILLKYVNQRESLAPNEFQMNFKSYIHHLRTFYKLYEAHELGKYSKLLESLPRAPSLLIGSSIRRPGYCSFSTNK